MAGGQGGWARSGISAVRADPGSSTRRRLPQRQASILPGSSPSAMVLQRHGPGDMNRIHDGDLAAFDPLRTFATLGHSASTNTPAHRSAQGHSTLHAS